MTNCKFRQQQKRKQTHLSKPQIKKGLFLFTETFTKYLLYFCVQNLSKMDTNTGVGSLTTLKEGENGKKQQGRAGAGRKQSIRPQEGETMEMLWHRIDTWLIKGADGATIAARFGVHPDTFYKFGERHKKWGKKNVNVPDFTAYKSLKKLIGDQNLRERQYDMAMGIVDPITKQFMYDPNPTMMIWVGKNRLGQSDRVDMTTGGNEIQPPKQVVLNIVHNVRNDKRIAN